MVIGIREAAPAIETWPITLPHLGDLVGVPIVMKPWWGSLRQPDPLIHGACGHRVVMKPGKYWEWVPHCVHCRRILGAKDIKTKRGPRRWICPGGSYQQIKWPEIQGGSVVIWEGKCYVKSKRGHKHSQNVEVMSVAQGAILLKLSVNTNTSHFLVGVDDGHPYVTPVHKKPETVEEAFDWLVPNMVKKAIAEGLEVRRQGEWHFIPTDKEPREDDKQDLIYFRSIAGNLVQRFYKHTLYRNMQLIYGDETRHRGQVVCYQNIFGLAHDAPLVKGKVTAPDHQPLYLPGWHIGVRNRSSNGGGNRAGRGGGD